MLPILRECLTLLIPGLLGAPQNRGRGWFPHPLHNFSISYAFTLKLVTGVHQRLVNRLVQKKIDYCSSFSMTSFSPRSQIFPQKLIFLNFFLQCIKSIIYHKKSFKKKIIFLKFEKNIYSLKKSGCQGNTAAYFPKTFFAIINSNKSLEKSQNLKV